MLVRLDMYDEFDKVLKAAEKIRQHAIATVGERAALFTNHFERDAYWYLNRHTENWERHVHVEQLLFGHLLDLSCSNLQESEMRFAAESRAPLHFACERFAESAACKELYLSLAIPYGHCDQLLYSISNSDDEPSHPVRVTLRHIYRSLNKPLEDWREWPAFVTGLPDHLLASARTTKELLLSDSKYLIAIENAFRPRRRKASQERKSSTITSSSSSGESELRRFFPFIALYPYPKP